MEIASLEKAAVSVIYQQSKTANNYWLIFSVRFFLFVLWGLFSVFTKKTTKNVRESILSLLSL